MPRKNIPADFVGSPGTLQFACALFCAAYFMMFLIYKYFFTHIGFINHTFPNVWVYRYPSFKTLYEGRWWPAPMG
jgi:hypothetical protein